jgi:hypothetical protein
MKAGVSFTSRLGGGGEDRELAGLVSSCGHGCMSGEARAGLTEPHPFLPSSHDVRENGM